MNRPGVEESGRTQDQSKALLRLIGTSQLDVSHYRFLGLDEFVEDFEAIESAADRMMAHLKTFSTGEHAELAQKLLNHTARLRTILLHREKKAAYDAQLRQSAALASPAPAAVPPPVVPAPHFLPAAEISAAKRDVAIALTPASLPRWHVGKSKPRSQWLATLGVALGALALAGLCAAIVFLLNTERAAPRANRELPPPLDSSASPERASPRVKTRPEVRVPREVVKTAMPPRPQPVPVAQPEPKISSPPLVHEQESRPANSTTALGERFPLSQWIKLAPDRFALGSAIGNWSRQGHELRSGLDLARLDWPVQIAPGTSYKVKFEAARLGKDDTLMIGLQANRTLFGLAVDGWPGRGFYTFFDTADGRRARYHDKALQGRVLVREGEFYPLEIEVRVQGAAVALQAKAGPRTIDWQGDDRYLGVPDSWTLTGPAFSSMTPHAFRHVALYVLEGAVSWK